VGAGVTCLPSGTATTSLLTARGGKPTSQTGKRFALRAILKKATKWQVINHENFKIRQLISSAGRCRQASALRFLTSRQDAERQAWGSFVQMHFYLLGVTP
jgi:hypothetical protein